MPSSLTRMTRKPPSSISIVTRFARASTEFSINSLTTLAGRSTTSPAAIWSASVSGRIRMLADTRATLANRPHTSNREAIRGRTLLGYDQDTFTLNVTAFSAPALTTLVDHSQFDL